MLFFFFFNYMRTEGKVVAVLVYNLEIQSLASSAALLARKQTEWIAQSMAREVT